jgi:hypothetical protein
MRRVHWMLVISMLLFVSGIGFVIAAERAARSAAPASAPETAVVAPPVATVKQLMQGMVMPATAVNWDSVSTTVSAAGVEERMPRTDEEWAEVAANAAVLVESANLLLQPPRAVDNDDWPKMAKAMATAGTKALEAAKAKSIDGILAVGEEINTTCDNCHERYSRN